ncbi:MAG: NAD(P)/FAD-dependent oxidoreductase [Balneolaceae bacterium]|nr:NAD(P)/FAD-dependent oxidoreductase [Balneolaceae bacterium]
MEKLRTYSGKNVNPEKARPYANHHQFLIIGGGTAGITTAAQLKKKLNKPDIAVIEPSDVHYYQPMWTFNGAGVFHKEKSKKLMKDIMPDDVAWIKDYVVAFHPEQNIVETECGAFYSYEYLVVAPGIQIDWDAIPGLAENIGTKGICSIYSYNQVDYVYECIKNMKKGRALFTQPNTKFKCGGAPQKIMYLSSDSWKNEGILNGIDVKFTSAGSVIFGVTEIAKALQPVIKRYGIDVKLLHNLKEIKADEKIAVYDIMKDGKPADEVEIEYDMLHVTPPMSSPDFIKNSPLADSEGWVDVDKHSLQHKKYPNVFSLGDAGSTPNAKTGAAVRKQAPVVTGNLVSLHEKGKIDENLSYDGYGSCPLITGYNKLILAEFDYESKMTPSFPFNQAIERRSMYHMKRDLLPMIYWQGMLKGRA